MKFILTLILICFSSNFANAFTNLPQNKSVIRALNKQTGRTKDIEIPVGQNQIFENISINIYACYTRPEDETPEDSAFIKADEIPNNFEGEINSVNEGKTMFSGWMFSSSPSLVAMEHPNYDIWLLDCKNDPNLPLIELPKEDETQEGIQSEEIKEENNAS